MRRLLLSVCLLFVPLIASAQDVRVMEMRGSVHLNNAMSQLSAADEFLGSIQAALERDAEVLAKLREAREMLEEDTQPITVVNAVAVRIGDTQRLGPHILVRRELIPVESLLEDFRRSSANIDLPRLTRHVDLAINAASDVVVSDVRTIQPILGTLVNMQEALQARVSGLVQAQGRAMEKTARRPRRR